MRISLRSFPSGTPAPRSTECITTLPAPKSVLTAGWIRVVHCQRVDSQQLLTQYSVQLWRSLERITTQAPNSLPTLTIGTCGSNRNASYRKLLLSQQPPDQSTLLYSPPRHRCGEPLARTPFHPTSKTRSRSHSVVWEDTYKYTETLSPALLFWVSRPLWRKQYNAFRKLPPRLQTLTLKDSNVQTVNDLLTMYVGAASQHVLRMSFVSEQEAQNFDRQVITYWSRLMHRGIASPLFFLPLKLGGLGVGSAVQRHAAAPWRAWQSIIPTLMATTQSPDTDSLFSSTPLPRAQLTQLQSTISQQMNKPTFQLKPLGAALRLQATQKKHVSTIQRNIHRQFYNSLTETPTEQAILLSQSTSHIGAHLMQPSSEGYEVEDRSFRVSVARRLMLPHPAAANPADVMQFCPNKSAPGVICNKPLDPNQHHCYGCRYGGGVDRRHAALARCLADIIQSHSGVKAFIEQEVPALTHIVNGQTEHARMDLVFNLNGSVTYLDVSVLLLPSLAVRPWSQQPAQNQDTWPKERRRPNSTGVHTSILFRSFLRPQAGLAHMPGNSSATSCEMLTTLRWPSGIPGQQPKCAPQRHLQTTTRSRRYVISDHHRHTQFAFNALCSREQEPS